MSTQQNRWVFEATVEPSDKVRLRGFIRNEIAYYNALLNGFQSRLRTMPDIFKEVDAGFLGTVAAHSINAQALNDPANFPKVLVPYTNIVFDSNGRSKLSERMVLFLNAISVATVLHPETRRAMALEMLADHQRQAENLSMISTRDDQVLVKAVELLHPHDGRLKRHFQLPAKAVVLNSDRDSIASAYTKVPIRLNADVPAGIQYNVVIVRDEAGTKAPSEWTVELRQEKMDYILRQTDAPLKNRRPSKSKTLVR